MKLLVLLAVLVVVVTAQSPGHLEPDIDKVEGQRLLADVHVAQILIVLQNGTQMGIITDTKKTKTKLTIETTATATGTTTDIQTGIPIGIPTRTDERTLYLGELQACDTKPACKELGTKHGVIAGCLSNDQKCHGISVPGNEFCTTTGSCSCCVPTPADRCENSMRLTAVQLACENILKLVCKAENTTCRLLNEDCMDLFCNMIDSHPTPNFKESHALYSTDGACDCDWSPGGCKISKSAPKGKACYCSYHVFWKCSGDVVNCNDSDSDYCKDPGITKESCLQGRGDCGAY